MIWSETHQGTIWYLIAFVWNYLCGWISNHISLNLLTKAMLVQEFFPKIIGTNVMGYWSFWTHTWWTLLIWFDYNNTCIITVWFIVISCIHMYPCTYAGFILQIMCSFYIHNVLYTWNFTPFIFCCNSGYYLPTNYLPTFGKIKKALLILQS